MNAVWIKRFAFVFAVAGLFVLASSGTSQTPAEAGNKKLFFGGHPGKFGAGKHHGNSYSNKAHNRKAKARARAKARAKAKARAAAKARARARARTLAAKKRKEQQARAAAAQAEENSQTESNTSVAPSTAALLTSKDIDANARRNDRTGQDADLAVATTNSTNPDDAGDRNGSATARETIGDPAGVCKNFIPEVGKTVTVDC